LAGVQIRELQIILGGRNQMVQNKSFSSRAFDVLNILFLAFLALICLLPFVHVTAVSFSASAAAVSNQVSFWPIGFNVEAYKRVFNNPDFLQAFGVSVLRVLVGTTLNLTLIALTAYPLSKENAEMKGRNVIIWFYIFPMLFSGGLIPSYLVNKSLGLINSFWVLVLPGAVQIFSILMMMHFFRGINKSLIEAAEIDGAGHLTILFKVFLPLSLPSIATLALFSMVGHWNDWFTGLIYLNDPSKWPLQTFLQQMIVNIDFSKLTKDDISMLTNLSNESLKAAQLLIATIPILLTYPFLQKYFVSGITIGSVKE
jgi:putative aldouronate transport system permease protein